MPLHTVDPGVEGPVTARTDRVEYADLRLAAHVVRGPFVLERREAAGQARTVQLPAVVQLGAVVVRADGEAERVPETVEHREQRVPSPRRDRRGGHDRGDCM